MRSSRIYLLMLLAGILIFAGKKQVRAQADPSTAHWDCPDPPPYPEQDYWGPEFLNSFNYLKNFPRIPKNLIEFEAFPKLIYRLGIDRNGKVQAIHPLKSGGQFLDSLFSPYLSKLRFTPAHHLGDKVCSWITVPINPHWIELRTQPEKPCRPDPNAFIVYDKEAHPNSLQEFRNSIGGALPPNCPSRLSKEVFKILVDEHGIPQEVIIMKTDCPTYSEKVKLEIMKLTFQPARKFGKPVCCWITLPINF